MKKVFSILLIFQLLLASFMATSHMALAGHDIHEKPHFHLIDHLDHDMHHHAEGTHSDHAGEIHIHLTFIDTNNSDNIFTSFQQNADSTYAMSFVSQSFRPLLPPPNTLK